MPSEIFFLSSVCPTTSIKSREIVKSEVRSHAARISHRKAGRSSYATDTKVKCMRTLAKKDVEARKRPLMLSQTTGLEVRSGLGGDDDLTRQERVSPMPIPSNGLEDVIGVSYPVEGYKRSIGTGRTTASENRYVKLDRCLVGNIEKIGAIYWNISAVCSAKFCSIMKTRNVLSSNWLQHMNDEAFFHVAAALVKGEHKELQSLRGFMDQEVFSHKIQAIKVIHARLTQSNGQLDNVTLLAILFLPFTDDLIADKYACLVHWSAAAKILATPGRLQTIKSAEHGAYTLDVINQVRGFCLAHTGFDLLSHIPKAVISRYLPFTSIRQASINRFCPLDLLPDGLNALGQCSLIGGLTLDLAHHINHILQSGNKPGQYNHTFDRTLDKTAPTSNFQEAWGFFNLKPSSIAGEPSIEEVIHVAMIVYSTRTIGPIRMAGFVSRTARAHLTIVVQQCMRQRSQEEEDALFWACIVAIESWTKLGEVVGDGIAIRNFHMRRFPKYLPPDISQLTLTKFFCDEELLMFRQRYMEDF